VIIFGHRFIKSEMLYHVNSISSIAKTPSNSLIYITFNEENLDIINHCIDNEINFALDVHTVLELIYAENFGASYITVQADQVKDMQKIANEYLFDAKILAHITTEEDIVGLAYQGIDGVLFSHAIVKISS
jgi:hypothetical protein